MNLLSSKAQQATRIVQSLRHSGFSAYLAGGCVRDLLLGREPADYDVATSATPRQVMELFPRTYAVGAQFGVVLVPVGNHDSAGEHDNYSIEVATFRRRPPQTDARGECRRRGFGSPMFCGRAESRIYRQGSGRGLPSL